ncbi:membrane-bound acid phosphatase precursor [Strigomonas culicis]|uniref:Membrane-bound acid phosphatase n=1 Tax=Strigomonas culicis TaxID=28005 RepID=S9U7K1_9TRYP|nr:membrane-bound acid phosphatase precursor [Strigomonas culicis]|eukprot:EPY26717.1 membrane-bound acid phosphatase precursor [Strigomonas culicis]
MRVGTTWMAVAFLVALALCASTVAGATLAYELLQVQVIHRHGSRSALPRHNQTLICGSDYPCGYLNVPGQRMLTNIGAFLRARYTTDATVVDPAAPFLPYRTYNLSVSHTRSTDVLRTLQSAAALLRGLFPDMGAYYPAIHTIDDPTDSLLNSGAIPVLRAKYDYGGPEEAAACNPVVDRALSAATLAAMAAEAHSQGYCAAWDDRMECAKLLCDIALAYEALGTLGDYPTLQQHQADVCAVLECSSIFLFAYNASSALERQQGSTGQQLAQLLIANMRAHLNGTNTFRLMEYSAHDTTLAPLAATLLDNSGDALFPPFATAYVVELLRVRGAAGTDDGAYAVRVLRGHPGVTPASNYTFAWDGFVLRCVDASGAVYVATDHVCPLADFARMVASSAPTSAAGLCHIDPVLLTRMNCPSTDPSVTLTTACLVYHQQCPALACGDGYQLRLSDYHCVASTTSSNNSSSSDGSSSSSAGLSTGGAVLLALCMLVAGAIIYYAVQRARDCWQYRQLQGGEEATDVEMV